MKTQNIEVIRVGLRVSTLRRKQGLSLRGLSGKVHGLSHSSICEIEYGGDMRVSTLFVIAKALGVKASYLLGEK